jgi:murein DD-endopeptidase MepM/ murein hydrolase activator NlpD
VIHPSGSQGVFGVSFGLDFPDVREWLFCPGMVFWSRDKWWGDRAGLRPRPHEGVDLLLYRDRNGRVCRLDETVSIPAISKGAVAGIIRDFLGWSVIVEHSIPGRTDERRYTIYAHTRPRQGICTGTGVNRGDAIATVAVPSRTRRFPMAPHLHVSVAWAPRPISCDRLDWDAIATQENLRLLDPLTVIALDYRLVAAGDALCREP